MKQISFKINNHKWKIELKPMEEMVEKYRQINPDACDCFGLTFRQHNKIYINNDLCEEEKIKTLKHELTHCFIWEYGYYYVDFNNEETICEFVASINDFINEVIDKVGEDNE